MLLAARYGSDVIVDLLKGFGIQYAALNPGATYRGLHDSVVNYGGNCPEIVTCTHEEIAVAIAHGYTKVTGKPIGSRRPSARSSSPNTPDAMLTHSAR